MTGLVASSSSLYEKDERILVLALLFEDVFSLDWIVELTGLRAGEVLSALEKLVASKWLKRKQPGIYSISHSKRHQIHPAFSPDERMNLHRRIVAILLAEPMDDDDKAKILSYHLMQINNDEMGCRWLKIAGDSYLKSFHTEQALKCYLKIFDDLLTIDSEETALFFMEAIHRYSNVYLASQKTTQVLSLLQKALDMAFAFDKPDYQALLMMNMATYEWMHSRYDRMLHYYKEAYNTADNLDNEKILLKIEKNKIFFHFQVGRFTEVTKNYERFVPEIMRFPKGRFPLLGVFAAAIGYVQTGQLGQGLGLMDAFRSHCQDIGDSYMQSYAVSGIASIFLDIHRSDEALPHFKIGLDMSLREGNTYMESQCRLGLALCHYRKGENEKCVEHLYQFIQHSEQYQINNWHHSYFLDLCWAIEREMLPPVAGVSLQEEINRLLLTKNVFMQGIAYRYRALLERMKGFSHEKILNSLKHSLKHLDEAGSAVEMSLTQIEIARQCLLAGKAGPARKAMMWAYKWLSHINEDIIPSDLSYLIANNENSHEFLLNEILALGQEIVDIREGRELVLKILSSVNRITGAERGALFQWDGTQLIIKASKNISSAQICHPDFAPSIKIIEEVASTGKGCIMQMKLEEKIHPFSVKDAVRTAICVPLILRGQVKGILYHDNRLLGSNFKKSDLKLLAYFAAQAAIALDNVASYEEIQKLNQKLVEEKNYFEEEYRFSKITIENIIGKSTPIQHITQKIQQVAQTDANVLILGDTGVGKELVASAIHQYSPRKDNPFICVQCSALPENLLPSELFGHEKGAFTGALKRRIGRFELADKGTIFLDEIGDIPPDMQVQLLRVLETRQFERIGGSETLRSDFRLIAATNRNLEKMCTEGRFRKDLYYRLNVFPIRVPTLRERKEDIPLLVDYFVQVYSKKVRKSFGKVSREDMDILLQYDWPGNIRELENIVERAVILNSGPILRFSDLLPTVTRDLEVSDDGGSTLSDNEKRYILHTLQKTKWKVRGPSGAAELLGINASTLFHRMKKLGINRSPQVYTDRHN